MERMTKEEMLRQEERSILNDMDAAAEKRRNTNDTNIMEQVVTLSNQNSLLRRENQILIEALKEIGVTYPESNTPYQDKILCNYLILIAKEAIKKIHE